MHIGAQPIPLPQIAHLPTLTFRHFRGEADFPTLVAVQHARVQVDQIDPRSSYESLPTLTSLAAESAAAAKFAPCDNTLVVEIDGQGIGYTTVAWWEEHDGTWLFLHEAFVIPSWRNQGIERALLVWSEHRLLHVAQALPTQGKAVWGANATSVERDRQTLLRGAGYQEVFAMLEMELPTLKPFPPTPPRIDCTIMHAQRAEYPALWRALCEAYAGRAMFATFSAEDGHAFVANPTHNPDFEFVAWDGDTVAGMVFVRLDDSGQGVVDECNVRPAYRRHGVATALLVQGLNRLHHHGVRSVRLHVRKQNETGAQYVYERLGFQVRKEFLRYRKPMPT